MPDSVSPRAMVWLRIGGGLAGCGGATGTGAAAAGPVGREGAAIAAERVGSVTGAGATDTGVTRACWARVLSFAAIRVFSSVTFAARSSRSFVTWVYER